jgi:hypothetical protein
MVSAARRPTCRWPSLVLPSLEKVQESTDLATYARDLTGPLLVSFSRYPSRYLIIGDIETE